MTCSETLGLNRGYRLVSASRRSRLTIFTGLLNSSKYTRRFIRYFLVKTGNAVLVLKDAAFQVVRASDVEDA